MSMILSDLYSQIIRNEIESYKRGVNTLDITNCPNCGAPVRGLQCEYCNTIFVSKENELKREINLAKAKIQHFNNVTILNDLYEDAIRAMRAYTKRN